MSKTKNLRPYPLQAGINTNVQILRIGWFTTRYGVETLQMTARTYKEDLNSKKQLNKVDANIFLTKEQREQREETNVNTVIPEQGDIEILPSWVVSRTKNKDGKTYSETVYSMNYARIQSMFMFYSAVLGKGFMKSFNRFTDESKFYDSESQFEESYFNKPEEMIKFFKDVSSFLEEVFKANESAFTEKRLNVLMEGQGRLINNDVGEKKKVSIQYAAFPLLTKNPESWFESYQEDMEQKLININTDAGKNYYARFLNSHIKAGDNYIPNKNYEALFGSEKDDTEDDLPDTDGATQEDIPF